MGGLFHIFEFNRGSMAKKVHSHKRHHGGLEAPRNSLELQVEASQACCPEGELPHYYRVEDDWSENNRYSNVASMKKLINEELSRRPSTRQNAPSVVARLMGIDMLPLDTKSVILSDERKSGNVGMRFLKKEMDGRDSVGPGGFSNSNSSNQMEFDSIYQEIDDDGWDQSFGKPRPREHPQEEELQKFKKEFEAFQAARFMECSKIVDLGSVSRQLLAQENLNKEKMEHCPNNQRVATEKPAELNNHSFNTQMYNGGYAEYHGDLMELIPAKQGRPFSSRSRTLSRDFEESLMMKSKSRLDKSSPNRIVILKPGPDRIFNHGENLNSSSGTLQERNSIEDFLEEVRERLKCELQGKTHKKGSVVRGSGIETPYNEKPSDPKQIARHIAKQVRESVTRDVGTNLLRSESTRSYRSEIQFNGPSSPEFVSRDTRRFLSEKLRNVLKSESHLDIAEVACGNSKSYVLDNHKVSLKQSGDILKSGNDTSQWEISKEGKEMQTGSFRHEPDDNIFLHREPSPRNLVRSLSAPVSGTSFGKLLLEDRHILTGAHIRRKLEAIETVSVDVRKRKKERFNIKEKVSNFKYSLVLRGKLFGKRIQSMVEPHGNEYDPMVRDVTSGPTVLLSCGERLENSTEVPPSPVSICSSAQEELWRRAECLSPMSTPDVSSRDDNVVPQVFRDISSNLNALRRQLNQLESDASDDFTIKQDTVESELVQLEDPAESYIRDLLVASGLYFGSWDKSLLRGDTFAKPIGNSVFEEVEESHRKSAKENESSIKEQKLEHKILLDLLNEALAIVLGPPQAMSRFRRKLSSSSLPPPPIGKELLKLVWDIIRVSLYPPFDISSNSVDNLVARDLGSIPWSALTNDEITVLEREFEWLITKDLIEEITKDMLLGVA
ncbi:hypothetical protein L6164_020258 [Bauhinia variegata]|uniref:Uncharacterized protein n=1 Tax=Bauhinia variegata TaxID=167791 RepID=A0ACB9MXW6_BAUVA|nr:hypothetical protein L6164_020258 [Bauhinia variegata]